MKVWFKRILIAIVVLVIAALVGIAIFLLTFDPNAYKAKLERIVYNRYHRTLAIKGPLEVSLFPRIGLSVHDVSLSDSNSDDTFASIDSARFAVAIWPLISNRLVVDHVTVSGFKAWIARDQHRRYNFDDLVGGPLPKAPSVAGSGPQNAGSPHANPIALATGAAHLVSLPAVLADRHAARTDFQIDIAGLDLKGGEIHYFDAVTGTSARIGGLDLNTGRVTFGQPFDVSVKGKLIGDYPVARAGFQGQAVVTINPEARTYSAQKLNLQIKGLLGSLEAKSATLQGNLAYDAYSRLLDVSNIELTVQGGMHPSKQGVPQVKNLDARLVVPQLRVDRSRSEFRVQKLALRAKGDLPDRSFDVAFDAPNLSISPDSAKGEPVAGTVKLSNDNEVLGVGLGLSGIGGNAYNLNFKELKVDSGLKQGDRLVQVNLSSPGDWDFLNERGGLSAMKGDVKIQDAALPGGSFDFPMIGSLSADLIKDKIVSEINAVLSGSKLDFKIKAKHLDNPAVAFDLNADSLDFNKLFPPTTGKAPDQAAAGQEKPAAKAAPATSKKAGPAPQPQAPAPSTPIDLKFLDSADVTGVIRIGALKVGDFQAKKVMANLRAAKGTLDVSKITADLYQGTLAGGLSASSNGDLALRAALRNVAVQPLLLALKQPARLTGVGSLDADLRTNGTTVDACIAGLTGTVKAQVRNGAIAGINVAQTLREASQAVKNALSGQSSSVDSHFDAARATDFASLDANLAFSQGQGTVKDLSIVAPPLRITEGKLSSIDLVNKQLDVEIRARVAGAAKGQGGLEDLEGVTVPLRISGPFDKPGYQVQWKDIGSSVVKQAVQHGLLDLLSKGVGGTPAAAAAPAKPESQPAQKQEPSTTVKSIGKALKGLLGQ
jgi:AsmA protein